MKGITSILGLLQAIATTHAFVTPTSSSCSSTATTITTRSPSLPLFMALDPVTYLRTEWVAAALCTNQTPRSADVVLQLGCEDGRVINFVPRTVREIITSSAEKEGGLTVSCERQLKQMVERRGSGASVTYSNQASDDLVDTPSSSVDIVISMLTAQRMRDNGQNWKRGIDEAARVLKPGGRFLFVEGTTIEGSGSDGDESYLDYLIGLSTDGDENEGGEEEEGQEDDGDNNSAGEVDEDSSSVFAEVGYDQVDLVLQPHIAGVAIKAMDADLTQAEKEQMTAEEENDRMAELSLNAFERGIKRRKRKKKKTKGAGMAGIDGTMDS